MFFKNELKKRIKNEKGLTLIELLAVIVILAIIAAIAIPAIGNIIANSRSKAVISDAQNAMSAANIYFTDNSTATLFKVGSATGEISQDEFDSYLESPGSITSIAVTKGTPNTITFSAKVKGKDVSVSSVTLDQLNKATVSKGVITIPASGSSTVGTNTAQTLPAP